MGVIVFSLWAFLGRGGEVLEWYITPLFPIFSINISLLLGVFSSRIGGWLTNCPDQKIRITVVARLIIAAISFAVIIGQWVRPMYSPDYGITTAPSALWYGDQTVAHRRTLDWIQRNIPASSTIIIDNSMWVDLHDGPGGVSFQNAHYFYKVDRDPDIRDKIFHNKWQMVDYVVVTPTLGVVAEKEGMELVLAAIEHSTVVARFDSDQWPHWPVEVRRVDKPEGRKRTG